MGLEIPIGWLTLLMFGSLLVLLMAGQPLAFVTRIPPPRSGYATARRARAERGLRGCGTSQTSEGES